MIITQWRTTALAVGGTASGNTIRLKGNSKLIYAKAANASTRFDFKLVDKNNDTPYEKKRSVGALRDREEVLLNGIYTWTISNSSVLNESFTIVIQLRETVQ